MPKNSKNTNDRNRCAIYARYSCHNQTEQSIEGQMHDCERYAEANGLQIVKVYIDRALSATSDRRPEFQQMIKDSASGAFDTILVWKLDRFARNRYDSAVYKRQLRSNGVTVVSVMEHITDSPEGVLMESVLEGFAEYFSRDLSQKVSRGMRETAQNCKITGTIPFGYRKSPEGKYTPDPITSSAVKQMFTMYKSGYKKCEIADWLNAHGFKTTQGNPFNTASVSRTLLNSRYTGKYTYAGINIVDESQRIISDDLFATVQRSTRSRTNAGRIHRASERYLLTDLLYCGHCRNKMDGESGHSHTGQTYHYYACMGRRKKHVCQRKNIRKEYIESKVISSISALIHDKPLLSRIADAILEQQLSEEKNNIKVKELINQLSFVTSKISNIVKAIEEGIITPTTKQRLSELESLKVEIETNIALAKYSKPVLSKERLMHSLCALDLNTAAEFHEKYSLIHQFVRKVISWEDKLVIIYNFTGSQDAPDDDMITDIEKAISEKSSDIAPSGTPDRIRTCGTKNRNLVLYPAELQVHMHRSARLRSMYLNYLLKKLGTSMSLIPGLSLLLKIESSS